MKLFAKKLQQSDIDKIVQAKLDWILKFSAPDKVILFGSASNGEMTEASDIDLILIYPNNSNLKFISLELAKNRPKEDWPHDPILQTQDSFEKSVSRGGGACWLALQEGKVLFERNSHES